MKRITTLDGSSMAITLLWLCAAATCAQGPAAKELDAKVVAAWKKAGAQAGWYGQGADGFWQFTQAQQKGPAALPGFRWGRFQPGVIDNLPAPATPFALVLETSGVTDAGLKELAGFQNLQTLNLNLTKVTDAGLADLAGLKNLQNLDLGITKVTDAGLKELAGLDSLQNLDLGYTKVTDAGLKELAGLKSLQYLRLDGTKVTDAGLKELAGLKGVQNLSLIDTKVTVAGVAKLRQLRPGLTIAGAGQAKPIPGPALEVLKNLSKSADTLLVFAHQNKECTLAEMAALVEKHYQLKIVIDEPSYQQKAPKVDILKTKVALPLPQLGLALSSVLHHALDELAIQSTFKIQGDQLVIYAGATLVVQNENRTGPAADRLTRTTLMSPKELQVTLGDALKVLEAKFNVAILVSKRQFATEDRAGFLQDFVKLPPLNKAPAENVLKQVLSQVNATYYVKYDHILVVPVKGKGKAGEK